MTPSPILKVLSSIRKHRVRYLLMGGQACVFYGGAEFSRDVDLVVQAGAENLTRLQTALDELQASCIAVPPFEPAYLEMGLAVHFRCQHPRAKDLRIDILTKMRGADCFGELWDRRTSLEVGDERIELLAVPDLVKAKKTQRDKDWPMITRLLEVNYFQNEADPTNQQIEFWFKELRTASLLIEIVPRFPEQCDRVMPERKLLVHAKRGDESAIRAALREEEELERVADRIYWEPLKKMLEQLRRAARK